MTECDHIIQMNKLDLQFYRTISLKWQKTPAKNLTPHQFMCILSSSQWTIKHFYHIYQHHVKIRKFEIWITITMWFLDYVLLWLYWLSLSFFLHTFYADWEILGTPPKQIIRKCCFISVKTLYTILTFMWQWVLQPI